MSSVDETNLTELEIAPDGRIFLFGASAEIMEILSGLFQENEAVQLRHERIQHQAVKCTGGKEMQNPEETGYE